MTPALVLSVFIRVISAICVPERHLPQPVSRGKQDEPSALSSDRLEVWKV